jgi:hypothetical protein
MTIADFILRLQEIEKFRDTQISERILIAGATAMLANLTDRIFDDGLATNEQQISPKYRWQKKKYTREDFQGVKGARFSANTTVKDRKTGKETPAMFIADGYEGFRRLAGRQTSYVDLELSGSLRNSIQVGKQGDNVVIGITSAKESEKRKKLEKLYKKDIFKPSTADIQEANDAIFEEIKFLINGG